MKVFMMIFIFIFFGCENQKKNIEVVDVDEVTDEVTDDVDVDEVTDEVTDEVDVGEVTDEVTDDVDVDEVTDEVTDEVDVDEVTDEVDVDVDEVSDEVDVDVVEVTDEVDTDVDEIDFKQFFSNKVIKKSISDFFLVRHARRYCDELEENGFSDWRLPTLKEGQLLIKGCQTMNPFKIECIINDEKIKGCTSCINDADYALFEGESEFFLTDSEISNGSLVGVFQPKFSYAGIVTSDSWQAVRCIRGNPFATE